MYVPSPLITQTRKIQQKRVTEKKIKNKISCCILGEEREYFFLCLAIKIAWIRPTLAHVPGFMWQISTPSVKQVPKLHRIFQCRRSTAGTASSQWVTPNDESSTRYSFKLKCWPHEGFSYHFDCIERFEPTSVCIDGIDPKFFFRGNNLAWNVNIIYYIILLVTTFITANEYIWNWEEDVPCQLLDLFLVWFKVSGILGSRPLSEYLLHKKVSFTGMTSL